MKSLPELSEEVPVIEWALVDGRLVRDRADKATDYQWALFLAARPETPPILAEIWRNEAARIKAGTPPTVRPFSKPQLPLLT